MRGTCPQSSPSFAMFWHSVSYSRDRATELIFQTDKRGRGAYGKTTVFGIFERDGQVYTEIVADCSKATLQGITGATGIGW